MQKKEIKVWLNSLLKNRKIEKNIIIKLDLIIIGLII